MTRPRLVHAIEVRATPEEVWHALMEPRLVEQYFFGLRLRAEAWSKGARVTYENPAGGTHMEGEILALDRPSRLVMSVRVLRDADTARDLPSRVTWEIEQTRGGCRLTVIHDQFEDETPTYRSVEGGWPVAIAGLKELLETGGAHQAQRTWPPHLVRPAPMRGSG